MQHKFVNGLCVCAHVRFVYGDKESKTVHFHNSEGTDRVHCYENNKSVKLVRIHVAVDIGLCCIQTTEGERRER